MPKAIDKKIRLKAKKLHCEDGKTLEQVAEILKLSFETIKNWHRVDEWVQIKEISKRKVNEKIIEERTKRKFDIIEEYYDTINKISDLTNNSEKLEANALLTTKQKYMKDLAQIEGKLTEKVKHEGTVQVIPILGGITKIDKNESI